MTLKTGFLFDPIYLKHDTGSHPENAGRLEHLLEQLRGSGLLDELEPLAGRAAEDDEVALVHDGRYQASVREACEAGGRYLGTMDCAISAETYQAAVMAAGGVMDAVRRVHAGSLDNAFCAVRPPGHHAERAEAMGFCYFNNVALAAETLVKDLGYERVLVFDFDVHHGNGTQHHFEDRKDVYFCSIHQDPRTCYPGTGFASERGMGGGHGYTLNCPMPPFSGDEDYLHAFRQTLLPVFHEYKPQFVLVSAGFDAHRQDPLAQQNLSVEGFDGMVEGMKELALEHAGGKMVSVLEGGYDYGALADCIESHIRHLQEEPA